MRFKMFTVEKKSKKKMFTVGWGQVSKKNVEIRS